MAFADIVRDKLQQDVAIEPLLKDFFLSPRTAVLYGGGAQSRMLAELCRLFNKKIICKVVSPGQAVPKANIDIPVYEVTELPAGMDINDYDVIVAMNEKYNREIISIAREHGFAHLFYSGSWFAQNELLRNLWYEAKFLSYGAVMRNGENGRFLEYRFGKADGDFFGGGGVWRMNYPDDDPLVLSNVSGTLHDLVLPSLFNEHEYVFEGPYEHGHVFLKEDDAVFDLGANVGLFTTVALAKGCRVWAFEPTPATLDILRGNLSLYPENRWTVAPYAVTDTTGKAVFNINENLSQDMTLGSNSLCARNGFGKIEVDTVSLDDFVEKNGIERVDFIKADIEGAERLMLAGAKRTLAHFAPKLALCTYHLPDDPAVMERLILEANPKYVIEHKWLKLYAYCR